MNQHSTRTISANICSASADNQNSSGTQKRLQNFLRKYNHTMVASRKKAAIDRCIEHGRILLAEKTVPAGKSDNLAGCALMYDLCDQDYVEIGSIRIPGKAGLGGFDIQSVLIAIASCQLWMPKALGEDGYAPKEFFATIAPENKKRQDPKFKQVGMSPWQNPPAELKAEKANTVSLGAEHPMFYKVPMSAAYDHARYLCEILDGKFKPRRLNDAGEIETLNLNFDLFLFRRLQEPLREMAARSKNSISDRINAGKVPT